ncbi:hypothetical protein JCM10213v2_001775 [Rhodosporidiobolus nylandii]
MYSPSDSVFERQSEALKAHISRFRPDDLSSQVKRTLAKEGFDDRKVEVKTWSSCRYLGMDSTPVPRKPGSNFDPAAASAEAYRAPPALADLVLVSKRPSTQQLAPASPASPSRGGASAIRSPAPKRTRSNCAQPFTRQSSVPAPTFPTTPASGRAQENAAPAPDLLANALSRARADRRTGVLDEVPNAPSRSRSAPPGSRGGKGKGTEHGAAQEAHADEETGAGVLEPDEGLVPVATAGGWTTGERGGAGPAHFAGRGGTWASKTRHTPAKGNAQPLQPRAPGAFVPPRRVQPSQVDGGVYHPPSPFLPGVGEEEELSEGVRQETRRGDPRYFSANREAILAVVNPGKAPMKNLGMALVPRSGNDGGAGALYRRDEAGGGGTVQQRLQRVHGLNAPPGYFPGDTFIAGFNDKVGLWISPTADTKRRAALRKRNEVLAANSFPEQRIVAYPVTPAQGAPQEQEPQYEYSPIDEVEERSQYYPTEQSGFSPSAVGGPWQQQAVQQPRPSSRNSMSTVSFAAQYAYERQGRDAIERDFLRRQQPEGASPTFPQPHPPPSLTYAAAPSPQQHRLAPPRRQGSLPGRSERIATSSPYYRDRVPPLSAPTAEAGAFHPSVGYAAQQQTLYAPPATRTRQSSNARLSSVSPPHRSSTPPLYPVAEVSRSSLSSDPSPYAVSPAALPPAAMRLGRHPSDTSSAPASAGLQPVYRTRREYGTTSMTPRPVLARVKEEEEQYYNRLAGPGFAQLYAAGARLQMSATVEQSEDVEHYEQLSVQPAQIVGGAPAAAAARLTLQDEPNAVSASLDYEQEYAYTEQDMPMVGRSSFPPSSARFEQPPASQFAASDYVQRWRPSSVLHSPYPASFTDPPSTSNAPSSFSHPPPSSLAFLPPSASPASTANPPSRPGTTSHSSHAASAGPQRTLAAQLPYGGEPPRPTSRASALSRQWAEREKRMDTTSSLDNWDGKK